ncbi:MAG: hypothetical protein IKY94_15080 [Lachnospiraceae bacterium]|jgi:hypothetical protein|nr:hypothetical protein [Lachnospiraceae bacterium]
MFVSRIKKDGLFEYGLCDLDERYIWNEALNGYELSSNGTFVKVIKAQSNGDKILDEFGAI